MSGDWENNYNHNNQYKGISDLLRKLTTIFSTKSSKTMIEIGSYMGESTMMFASIGLFKTIHSIEPHKGTESFNEKNDWYNWRNINESKLPDGIILPEGNQYSKNIALKESLHLKWKSEKDIDKKGIYIAYYIRDWGGIRGNKMESLREYQEKNSDYLIKKGVKGVASWSKALVLHNPNEFAIFDARVSASLNCLQIIDSVECKELFPVLASQNKTITMANKKFKEISKSEKWDKKKEFFFYKEYLNILKRVAEELDTNISTVEMLLFAKAEELIGIALKN